jgi:hypothetical protein
MGWWNVEGREIVLGDVALNALNDAVSQVVEQYRSALDRRPTRAEWEAMLLAVLGAEEPEARAFDRDVARAISIEMAPSSEPGA